MSEYRVTADDAITMMALAVSVVHAADAEVLGKAADGAARMINDPACSPLGAAVLAGVGFALGNLGHEIKRTIEATGGDPSAPPQWALVLLGRLGVRTHGPNCNCFGAADKPRNPESFS